MYGWAYGVPVVPPPPHSSMQVEEVMVNVTGTDVPAALEELNWIEPV